MRYFLVLSYDGAEFCGWQIQPGAPSVQACLEAALSRLLNRSVQVTGAGRTDTGVHAFHYVAHFDIDGILPFEASDFTYKLNAILPRSVAVLSVSPVLGEIHARFSARRREYTYFIHRQKDPFVRAYSWQCGYPGLDFEAMNEACQHLLGTHDFSCFEKTGGDNKTSICTVAEAFWKPYVPSHLKVFGCNTSEGGAAPLLSPCGSRPLSPSDPASAGRSDEHLGTFDSSSDVAVIQTEAGWASQICGHPRPHKREGPAAKGCGRGRSEAEAIWEAPPVAVNDNYWYFRIVADRFLRNMVRATVGTLIEVGRGKHSPEWVAELMASGTRSDAGESVPGHALFLNRVLY